MGNRSGVPMAGKRHYFGRFRHCGGAKGVSVDSVG